MQPLAHEALINPISMTVTSGPVKPAHPTTLT